MKTNSYIVPELPKDGGPPLTDDQLEALKRAWAVDAEEGRLNTKREREEVEKTIASLPPDLRAEVLAIMERQKK